MDSEVPFSLFKSNPKFCTDHFAIMIHISASTAPIRVKQKPLYSKLNAESDTYYYNSLCRSLENPPESLLEGGSEQLRRCVPGEASDTRFYPKPRWFSTDQATKSRRISKR